MSHNLIHQYFIFNDEIKPVSEYVLAENNGGIYEVLRVIKGVPLFWKEHLDRLFRSAEITGLKLPYNKKQITDALLLLISENNVNEGNVMISYHKDFEIFFIKHKYPTKDQYINGVKCAVLNAERTTPNAKIFQKTVRSQANKMLEETGFYEVLLVDKHGFITEGSRSNVFFIKGKAIFTTPAKVVLMGITRQQTMLTAVESGVPVKELPIALHELSDFDAAFITGTSPNILPILSVDAVSFDVNNNVLRKLMKDFRKRIEVQIVKELK